MADQVPSGSAPVVVGVLNAERRVEQISSGISELLGYLPADVTGPEGFDPVHPEDRGAVLGVLDQAARSNRAERLRLRIRHKAGHWSAAALVVAPLNPSQPSPFGFVLTEGDGQWPGALERRVEVLEDSLRRIGEEVRAARASGAWAAPEGGDIVATLSGRQRDIVERLLVGRRVATIAKELGISASTVRNHLSQIFRRVGVGSQAELVETLQRETPTAQ